MIYITEGREVEIGGIDNTIIFDFCSLPKGVTAEEFVEEWNQIIKQSEPILLNSDDCIVAINFISISDCIKQFKYHLSDEEIDAIEKTESVLNELNTESKEEARLRLKNKIIYGQEDI